MSSKLYNKPKKTLNEISEKTKVQEISCGKRKL
jgi:hypothetical protein